MSLIDKDITSADMPLMTVSDLKQILADLPDDMGIMVTLPSGDSMKDLDHIVMSSVEDVIYVKKDLCYKACGPGIEGSRKALVIQ